MSTAISADPKRFVEYVLQSFERDLSSLPTFRSAVVAPPYKGGNRRPKRKRTYKSKHGKTVKAWR